MSRLALCRVLPAVVAGFLSLTITAGTRAEGPVNVSERTQAAIEGVDPVAYFAEGRPIKGARAFEHVWMGATWRFASQANRDAFAADPARFAPQYGGYCAWAVSQGYTATIDPEAWRIVDGKLYLNYSKGVQAKWARDIPGNIRKADANCPGILAKLTR
jgi:YHS domain-containing protein